MCLVPELPPRGPAPRPAGGVLLPAPPPARPPHTLRHNTTVCLYLNYFIYCLITYNIP